MLVVARQHSGHFDSDSSDKLQPRLATFVRALSNMKIAAISPVGPVRRTANNPNLGKPMVRTPLFCFLNQDLPVHVWFTDLERHWSISPMPPTRRIAEISRRMLTHP
jgi:hypothetical protein